jgi:UDP-glucose 4-epimerase
MKVLVTGGAGFIASHVVDRYVNKGLEVVIVDDLSRGSMNNVNQKARFYKADIRNYDAMHRIFEEERPDYVNHHAAQMDLRRAVFEPAFDAETNIIGSIHLLNLAVEFKTKRIIYASTGGAAYGEPLYVPMGEDHPVNPNSPYGISKHTVEHYLFNYRLLYGLEYVVLRYGNVYGPRQSSKGEAGVVAIFCEQILANETPKIFGNGQKTRDYIYAADVAQANVQALDHGNGHILNIAFGKPTTDFEIFEAVCKALGIQAFEPSYAAKRPGEVDHCYLKIDKATRELKWMPKVPLAEGLKLTANFFREKAAQAEGVASR